MITCQMMHCGKTPTCHLEENGATDLCPVLQAIKAEAIAKVESAWTAKYPPHEVVVMERYQGTVRTVAIGFTVEVGLKHMAALELAKREASIKTGEFMRKHKLEPVALKPEPMKWIPERSDFDFHEMPTQTHDYSAYTPLDHIEDIEAAEMKKEAQVTKKQRAYWRDLKARGVLLRKQDEREQFLAQLLDDMDDDKQRRTDEL